MPSFDLEDITKALQDTSIPKTEEEGISFEGKNLVLNTAEDAKLLTEAIDSCTCLEYLNLAGNTLGVEAAETLAKSLEKHPELKRALWKDLFTGRLKEEIPKALEHLGAGLITAGVRLSVLDLSDNAFGRIGVKGLASLLSSPTCYNLTELRLNNNGLGIAGARLLASALTDCHKRSGASGTPLSLRVFVAGRNRLENEGATALAEVFKAIGTLEEITIPQNGIYYVGITALTEAFALNPKLSVLNLNDNTLSVKGARALAQVLPRLQQLRYLNLGDCLLRNRGASHIAAALRQGHTLLEYLNLESNEIGAEAGVDVVCALANKRRLQTLALNENHFGEDGRERILGELSRAGLERTLGPMDDDETDGSDEDDTGEGEDGDGEEDLTVADEDEDEEDDEDDEENQEEENEQEEHDTITTEEENKIEVNVKSNASVTVEEFLSKPSAENFLGLGDGATKTLVTQLEIGGPDDESYLDRCVPLVMKVCALAADHRMEVSSSALASSDALLRRLFERVTLSYQRSLMVNSLLVHLGLIKSEDKKYRPSWDVSGCLVALEHALDRPYIDPGTQDTLRFFLQSRSKTIFSTATAVPNATILIKD